MEREPFKPGDLVVLKSGGPTMVVERIEDNAVHCRYYRQGTINYPSEMFNAEFESEALSAYVGKKK